MKLNVLIAIAVLLITSLLAEGILRWLDVLDPPIFQVESSYGYLMVPDQSVSPKGYRFRINNSGFRGLNFAEDKRQNTIRIAFLGDSITYGGGSIHDDELFVNRASNLFEITIGSPVEPLNLSAPGWGIQNIAGYIAVKGTRNADHVVWILPSVDFRRPKRSIEMNNFLEQKPKSRLGYGIWLLAHKSYLALIPADVKTPTHAEHLVLNSNLLAFKETLARLQAKGIRCLVVTLPSSEGYVKDREDLIQYRLIAESLAAPFLDVGPLFARYDGPSLYIDGMHLSPHGHRLIANSIASFLMRSRLAA